MDSFASLFLILISSFALAREAPGGMTQFNVECPAPKECKRAEWLFKKCSKHRKSEKICAEFADQIQQLLPEYDCQRPVDGKSIPKYIVPAVWLCGDKNAESYLKLISRLKVEKARNIVESEAYRNALTTSVVKHDTKLREIKNRTLPGTDERAPASVRKDKKGNS